MSNSLKKPIEFIVSAAAVALCCGGRLYGLAPFGAAMFCALSEQVFFGVIAPVYILCTFLYSFEVWRLFLAGAAVFIVAARWLFALKFKKLRGAPAAIMFSLAALSAHAVLIGVFSAAADGVLTWFIGVVFYCFARPAAACAVSGFAARPSGIESAALCVVAAVCALTLGAVPGDIRIWPAVCFCAAMVLCVIGAKPALAGGVAMAIGLSFKAGAPLAIAFMGGVAAAVGFRAMPRPVFSLIAVGCFSALSVLLYLDALTIGLNAALAAAGALPVCVLPRRAVKAIRTYFDYDGSARLAVRHYINRTRADAGNRMLCVAAVFDETARLINAFCEPQPDMTALGEALIERFCPYCPNNTLCGEERHAAFAALAGVAHSGRPVITELPEFFTSACVRTAEVMGGTAEITERARIAALRADSDDRAKAVVTERLTAVKDVLEELGTKQALPVGFDGDGEDRIVSELAAAGIECAEAFVTRDGITAIIRSRAAERARITKAVSAAMRRRFEVLSLEKTQAAGWSVVSLKARPTYEAVYARAGVSKTEGVSGDSYTFKRIGDKFLAALADGMGSGESASLGSDCAVELIECFYRAGFDSQSVLSGVNRFLKLPGAENYSAADVVVCDLDTAGADIIKLGAPPCYIKTADTVLRIDGHSLPIGVLDEMRPFVTSKRLYPGQMLIMATDGVSDCFCGDQLPEYINGLKCVNPETVASDILRRALTLSGGTPRDDMTVIAFRLFEPRKRFFGMAG